MRRFILLLFFFVPLLASGITTEEFIRSKNEQIEALARQIEEYQNQIEERQKQGRTLSGELDILNKRIAQIQAEIRSLSLAVEKANGEIGQTVAQIGEAESKMIKHRQALGSALRILDQAEQENLIEIILKNENLSAFFGNLTQIKNTQENLRAEIGSIRELKNDLEDKEETLRSQKKELESLKNIQQIGKRSAEQVKTEKNNLLKATKGEESRFQELVKKSKTDIEKIRAQIYYLQQNGISAEDAVKFAQLAAAGAGIRPAFLLGILEIESKLGQNVGTGSWEKDMYQCYLSLSKIAKTASRKEYYLNRAESEKNAFFAIIGKLGLDPSTVKVSREPSYGCGGALGPAQFIPTTWLGYETEVARLTGHNPPNPWNVEDAFTASAIKLARAGATLKTRAGESAAARAYISGNAKCTTSTCNSYANAVLRKADEIEQNL
ncbi:MAG: hypothetical protein A3C71_02020 [Candidatus Yanofskybacteria bacterium RIFCSPHIGHO2_02_FULL_43_15c]|uniref:Transglycosylase SLT domain-containing protein n=2 Tax=Candidatus Yanofskyibacteriota TaxID=1752733 RepID=A0A1F8H596_9BACT|nr:MAG: hypothetical protein A3C71_02020 [Candidatus Yanofskybacteria bacterium RIFCSPHIGHO2_02_FULL_43_15c]OGN32761.1 MAG: hypothetical protein A3I92_01460 [Candidatus Yanofskybacteria bacterium RIFCSPLOWO2_02_FULL_43_10b]